MTTNALNGRRILVVEDEYVLALDLCELLAREGATIVGPVGCLQDALAMIESDHRVDIGVLDIKLHSDLVYPVAARLRQLGVPYLFVTGYGENHIDPAHQAVPHLHKPVRLSSILEAIRRATATTARGGGNAFSTGE